MIISSTILAVKQEQQPFHETMTWRFPDPPPEEEPRYPPAFELTTPTAVNSISATCGAESVRVEVKKDLLGIGKPVLPADVSLGGCPATGEDPNTQVLVFESALHGCGSQLVVRPCITLSLQLDMAFLFRLKWSLNFGEIELTFFFFFFFFFFFNEWLVKKHKSSLFWLWQCNYGWAIVIDAVPINHKGHQLAQFLHEIEWHLSCASCGWRLIFCNINKTFQKKKSVTMTLFALQGNMSDLVLKM